MNSKKYGWWEPYLNDNPDDYKTRCTACGGEAPTSHDDGTTYAWETPKICPHCGAEMLEDVQSWVDDNGDEYITLKYPHRHK